MAGTGGFLSSVEKMGIGPRCWDGGGGGIVDGAAYLPGVMRGWAGAQGDDDVSAGEGRAWWLSPQCMAATTWRLMASSSSAPSPRRSSTLAARSVN
jgi:hypothetical protein